MIQISKHSAGQGSTCGPQNVMQIGGDGVTVGVRAMRRRSSRQIYTIDSVRISSSQPIARSTEMCHREPCGRSCATVGSPGLVVLQ